MPNPRRCSPRKGLIGIMLCLTILGALVVAPVRSQSPLAVQISVQDIIGPATADHIIRHLDHAVKQQADLFIIELDTPGGLDSSMRAIIQAILRSPIPVATFVSPAGARAASAGTFILYASHIAAMVPASNLGAASPVSIGGGGAGLHHATHSQAPESQDEQSKSEEDDDGDDDDGKRAQTDVLTSKVTSDAAAYLRSLAQLRDRNAE